VSPVESPVNRIVPKELATNLCAIPELFVIPVPLMVNVRAERAAIVNLLAPALNTMPFTSVSREMETRVIVDTSKVAMSDGPFGGPPAVQFAAVPQDPVAGLANHVALPANVVLLTASRTMNTAAIGA
jgi:hypothetical protein